MDNFNDDFLQDNENVDTPKNSSRRWLIIGGGCGIFLVCVLPICMIALLTLLGPQIGDVFSTIVETLEAPTP